VDGEGGISLARFDIAMTSRIRKFLEDDNGLVSAMEMTLGIMLSFVFIVFGVLMILYALMGTMINNAALVSARAGTQYQFPTQAAEATRVAQEVFTKAIPESPQATCTPLSVTTPTTSGQSFVVSSVCTVNLGTFLGHPISTTWTATASVPVAEVAN
jgi:Na+-transporting methylmalonyl-CoA/oxaloacetate decarboxylase gamma subunit